MPTTFQDTVEHLIDYLGGGPTDAVLRDCRRAVLAAYRDLATAFRWKYLLAHAAIPVDVGIRGYPLPEDFLSLDRPRLGERPAELDWVAPGDWPILVDGVESGTPARYTILGDPTRPGRLMIHLGPSPDVVDTLSFLYVRRPRPLRIVVEDRGTVTVSGPLTLVGTGTAFTPAMVGAVLRVSRDLGQPPTGVVGKNPAFLETTVVSVEGPTAMTMADPSPLPIADASYTISDMIDIEEGAMLTAFLRGCEHQVAGNRTLKDQPNATKRYYEALAAAKGADMRTYAVRSVGDTLYPHPRAWRQLPDDI